MVGRSIVLKNPFERSDNQAPKVWMTDTGFEPKNQLFRKWTLNHSAKLASLAKWLRVFLRVKVIVGSIFLLLATCGVDCYSTSKIGIGILNKVCQRRYVWSKFIILQIIGIILNVWGLYPVGTGRKLNVHKTFRRRPGRLLNILCTFSLHPVPTRYFFFLCKFIIPTSFKELETSFIWIYH